MATFLETINTKNPKFLKEYEGRYISTPEGFYKVEGGKVSQTAPIQGSNYDYFDTKSGLAPAASGSYQTSDAFRYYNPTTVPQEQTSTNFGMGTTVPAEKYTGQTAGYSSGGATLYKLTDGSVTATPPPGTEKPAFINQTPATDATVQAATTGKVSYGDILTLSNGQRISPNDPNYAAYAKQMGVVPVATTAQTALDVAGAKGASTVKPSNNQILNIAEMAKYKPGDYQRLPDGRVVLNEGVTPIPGTIKTTDVNTPAVGTSGTSGTGGTETGGKVTGSDIMTGLGLDSKTNADYIADAMSSPEFDWFLQKYNLKNSNVAAQAQAAQEMLDTKYAGEKSKLENSLASRGLAFSGIRASQVAGLAANLAASKLEIDRKMAMQILDLDNSLMDTVLGLVADKVKEAADGRKEALGMLEDMGLTINPITGELTPTIAARSAARLEAGQDFSQQLQLAQLELSSQPAIYREWLKYQEQGGSLGFNDYQTMDANRKRSVNVTNIINPEQNSSIVQQLEASKDAKGYANIDTYVNLRNATKDKTTFDKNYSYLLDPTNIRSKPFIAPDQEKAKAPFLSAGFFLTQFPREDLYKLATGKTNVDNVSASEIENISNEYVKNLLARVSQYRTSGFTDDEILKLLQ